MRGRTGQRRGREHEGSNGGERGERRLGQRPTTRRPVWTRHFVEEERAGVRLQRFSTCSELRSTSSSRNDSVALHSSSSGAAISAATTVVAPESNSGGVAGALATGFLSLDGGAVVGVWRFLR